MTFPKLHYDLLKEDRSPLSLDSVVIKALLEIPHFESISEDLKRLQDHNSRVDAHNKVSMEIEEWFKEEYLGDTSAVKPDRSKLEEDAYQRFRDRHVSQVYQILKRVQVRQSTAQWLLGQNAELDARAVETALEALEKHDPVGYYRSFDVDFRARRFYYLTRQLIEDIRDIAEISNNGGFATFDVSNKEEPVRELLIILLQQKAELLAFASEALDIRHHVHECLEAQGVFLTSGTLDQYLDKASPLYQERFQDLAHRGQDLLAQIDSALETQGQGQRARYRIMSDAFELRDTFILPITYGRRLGERDYVDLVPITPVEARFIPVSPERKLAGESLFHFGGFFQEEWRKKDIMWGRLDAAEMIVRFLIKRIPPQRREFENDEEELGRYLMPIQKQIVMVYEDDFSRGSSGERDYRQYLQDSSDLISHTGNEAIKNLPPREVVPVAVQALGVAHGLAETLEARRRGQGALALAYGWVAKGLGYVNNFVNVAATLLFPQNNLLRFSIAILVLGALGWSTGVLAVHLIGFQSMAPATLILAVLVGLICVAISAFSYQFSGWKPRSARTAALWVAALVILAGLAFLDVRYSDSINEKLGGTGTTAIER